MTPPPPETSDERRYPLAKYFVENHPEIEPSDAWAKEAVDLYRERDALKVKRDVALRAWKGAAADRDKAQRQVAELKAEVASLKVENERLKQSAVEVAKLNQPNLEQIMALSVEVESLKAKLAAPSAGEGHGSKITRP
jgi:uncharacterized small protein (DUF1192 family)